MPDIFAAVRAQGLSHWKRYQWRAEEGRRNTAHEDVVTGRTASDGQDGGGAGFRGGLPGSRKGCLVSLADQRGSSWAGVWLKF